MTLTRLKTLTTRTPAILAALSVLAAGAGPAAAQTKTGTTILGFLGIEPDARQAAMGNAGVGLCDGIASVYYNAAAIGSVSEPSLQLTHSEWYAGIRFDHAAFAMPAAGLGTFYASFTSLNSGDMDVRTVSSPLGTGERYAVQDLSLGLGYGRRITSRFGVGGQVTYARETIWHSSIDLMTFSIGTVYQLSESGLKLGAGISNLGTSAAFNGRDLALQYDPDPEKNGDNSALPASQLTGAFPVPIVFRVGLAYPWQLGGRSRLIAVADADHPSDNSESVSSGLEWSWRETFAVRAGYQHLFQEDSNVGLTLGVGLRGGVGGAGFKFDYAWAEHDYLEDTHRLTFVLAF